MKDKEIIRFLRENKAHHIREYTHHNNQVMPCLELLDNKGSNITLPEGININHAMVVMMRNNLLDNPEITERSQENYRITDAVQYLSNLENSMLLGSLKDLSCECNVWKIST